MLELALGLAIACSEAAYLAEEELVLRAAVHLTMPPGKWDREARALCKRYRADAVRTAYLAGPYYDEVAYPALRESLGHWWHEELVWYCSSGKVGKAPSVWAWWNLGQVTAELLDRLEEEAKK